MEVGAFCMIADYYTQTFTVEAPTTTKSSIGGWNPTYSSFGTFKGWLDKIERGNNEYMVGAQVLEITTHVIGCSSTNSWVLNTHRIKDADGLYYRILNNDNPIERDHHREIMLNFNQSDQLST